MAQLSDLQGTYDIDATHSTLNFVTRHAMITKVRGAFDDFSGTAVLDGTNPDASHVEVTVNMDSIDTRVKQRDDHLRSGDFFDVEQFPTMTFASTGVEVVSLTEVNVTGDLTIRDVTKSITLPMELTGVADDPMGNHRVGFEGSLNINRKDWGLTWNAAMEAGGVLVSEKVAIELDISLIEHK